MKMSKRGISVFLLVLVLTIFVPIIGVKNVKASYATQIGFTVDDSEYQFLKWMDIERQDVYVKDGDNNYRIGAILTKIGVYKMTDGNDIPQGKDAYAYGYKTIVQPMDYQYTKKVLWWTETVKRYGYSEELNLKIDLWQWTNYPYASRSELIYSSPVTLPKDYSYSVGFNGGIKSDGSTSLGFSTGAIITSSRLEIRNKSLYTDGIFEVNYNYVPVTWRWEDDSYLFDPSAQYGMFIINVEEGIPPYLWVHINSKFGVATADGGWNADCILGLVGSGSSSVFKY